MMTFTRTRRLAARTAAVTTTALAALAIAGAPAHARPRPVDPELAPPQMRLDIIDIRAVGFHVCAYGTAATSGTWRLTITGARANGTVINLSDSHTGSAWTSGNCLDVLEYGTLSGEWQAAFTFVATIDGRSSAVFGGGTWDILSGEHSWDTA